MEKALKKPLLILDCNFLCWRSFHALPDLNSGERNTAILFGFLRDLNHFSELFRTDRFVFAFDHGPSVRKQIYPAYKSKRAIKEKEYSREERKARQHAREQIEELRCKLLPQIGYQNVCSQEGYEADDVIASVCKGIDEEEEVIIISSDQDLLQLLRDGVSIYNPMKRETITYSGFVSRYRILPGQWPKVKAIAGCSTDDVLGVDNVGEVTAIQYVIGELTKGKRYEAICAAGDLIANNLPLVRLPYVGTRHFKVVTDEIEAEDWDIVMKEYELTSLVGQCPIIKKGKMLGQR